MSEYFIWWINSSDECDLVLQICDSGLELPPYLITEVISLSGRPARGRLWVPPDIEFDAIRNPSELLEISFFEKRGGIVFHAKDYPIVRTLPGFITNTEVEIIEVEG